MVCSVLHGIYVPEKGVRASPCDSYRSIPCDPGVIDKGTLDPIVSNVTMLIRHIYLVDDRPTARLCKTRSSLLQACVPMIANVLLLFDVIKQSRNRGRREPCFLLSLPYSNSCSPSRGVLDLIVYLHGLPCLKLPQPALLATSVMILDRS
jgi:hypothetical protein